MILKLFLKNTALFPLLSVMLQSAFWVIIKNLTLFRSKGPGPPLTACMSNVIPKYIILELKKLNEKTNHFLFQFSH